MNLILIGPPASGKGTQSLILSKLLNIFHVSIGDVFRKNLKNKTELGKKIIFYINKGLLVPSEITNSMVSEIFTEEKIKKGFIFDGFPRNKNQALFLTEEFKKRNISLAKVFYFNVEEKLLEKRIVGRIICSQCGEIYHKETKLPKKDNLCDNDNSILIQRKDDNLNTFKKRLLVYKEETLPLVEYYQKINKLFEIKVKDNKMTIEEITNIILKNL
ncbi:MAG: nucleoside monophosphate kinase [Candidatus Phytoplasma stylosanthis]|uniref:adenylate kinase family protein n=1 Tax=Candidatus Phytoplasma stylosanthis TaxID=2798314 RepID=UPI00293A099C|nr:nucleoside monophosphate kinase [Candidatus Phytoplasma stylosanthis]MDV3167756.1 nucleoside monophosphate kinase [Candidatus Phytoplasma stylosanthis]MDV3170967.1 nucleoside monophosphate kinase [Candidatus Phytoplasma stylosanthis]MDV3173650.1 nucleoside monophosphate kinase [Candidatus Phytoplasma stylosanthis]MDV3174139.1 nucleoside monophosphate kinase [Candidatus Phytoplasma stylosanthis]MDV3202342.1 nucleoside monophosphate kinase [Candidatus Phytoplasma stylosanthis]